MFLINILIIIFGKLFSSTTRLFNLGNGSTWPGHIALTLNPQFIRQILQRSGTKLVLVAGTNGKTTTAKLITTILEADGNRVLQNSSGANLLNGLASSLLLEARSDGRLHREYAVFEVDENTLPQILQEVTPDFLILLNLFRDQLDRYGEVTTIANNWKRVITQLPDTTTVLLNADDPLVAFIGIAIAAKTAYFGVAPDKKHKKILEHAGDSLYCPNCGNKLQFKSIVFSHLGQWACKHCHFSHPETDVLASPYYPLPGTYNQYNTHAAVLFAQHIGLTEKQIELALQNFAPAFGRQEELFIDGKRVRIYLSKNPTGFNESLRTVKELGATHILFVLNDRIPDGRDVSWIWDTDIENILDGNETIVVSGDRVYDMALRLKYSTKMANGADERSEGARLLDKRGQWQMVNSKIFERLEDAIGEGLAHVTANQTLYILPTYSAMLETRKILTGKKIL